MLQPKKTFLLLAAFFVLVDSLTGLEHINSSSRKRRENTQDVTTVLLVDNHGRPSYGRFLNVKPDVGLITSTARTFVQEGVTTEYATQVVGTTLDDGRLYAHLLTKTSRVIYDGRGGPHEMNTKLDINQNQFSNNFFVKNTDFISPNHVDTTLVFPTKNPSQHQTFNEIKDDISPKPPQEIIEEEILKESPSNNIRFSSEQERKHKLVFPQNNVRVFKVKSNVNDERENVILHKEEENLSQFQPSKVKEWDNIPTFTIRNEFSPSGFSYLGDLPDFNDKTEKKKLTTPYDRRAKNLFLAGLLKPSPKELKTTTYTGFADFTTTVGDTVIIFTPHTSSEIIQKPVTKITVEPTIRPTVSFILPPPEMKTEILSLEMNTEPTVTEIPTTTEETIEDESKKYLQSKVIDKSNRQKYGKNQNIDQLQDMEAKASVLAHEQQGDILTSSTEYVPVSDSIVIESSESQTTLLSTPSQEDIAKIFASLQAQASQATEPLNTPSTIFFDIESAFQTKDETQSSGGATTIFFEDDLPIQNTATWSSSTVATTEIDTTTNSDAESYFESTTESQRESTLNNPSTSEKQLQSSDEEAITTEHETENTTPLNEETTTDDASEPTTTNEVTVEDSIEESCTNGIQIIPTTIYKTLTYLTTFFIPVDDSTTTSINSGEVVTSHIELQTKTCSFNQISPTNLLNENVEATISTTQKEFKTTSDATEQTTTEEIQTTEPQLTTEQEEEFLTTTAALETTPQEITTERKHVTESEPTTTEQITDEGEEIELIFKTLYTTYTYLTTYFQDTTSSIASRIVVTTNVVTSTLDPGSQSSEDAVAGVFDEDSDLVSSYKSRPASFEDFAEISPSQLDSRFSSSDIDGSEESESTFTETPQLTEQDVATTSIPIKTYYTTYTYFTTIFVDGETEVSSRTEVYTNYVTPSIKPTGTYDDISETSTMYDGNNEEEIDEATENEYEEETKEKDMKKKLQFQINPSNKYNKTISRDHSTSNYNMSESSADESQDITTTSKDGYVTLRRTTTEDISIEDNLLNLNDYESVSTMVRSSTSDGERRLLNNVDKRNILDDQIVSESNNDSEIIPSPTLLLQTSYTTFTYFTTMYQGTTGSNVVSRLETVTNIVTETLTPSHTLSVEDLSLPITYFTTFTYWTTLYKQGTTKVTSREETVSNVITPTAVSGNSETSSIEITSTSTSSSLSSIVPTSLQPSAVDDDYSTTVYTTYTYYTTSYVGDETVINSRLETVTSILNKTNDIELNQSTTAAPSTESGITSDDKVENKTGLILETQPTGLLSTVVNTVENSGTTTVLSTDVIGTYINGQYAQILDTTSSILTKSISPNVVENLKPTGIVSINQGQIVDADEISTLYYTTQAVGTYINNVYAQVIQSTSSLKVNEDKKASLSTETPIVKRTGLVRLVQGSMIQNKTTTLYQSKVIGTIIDGRYAQIIESTSSFLVDKPSISIISSDGISPTSTLAPSHEIKPTSASISPSSAVIEGSISESAREEDVTKEVESLSTKTKPSFQAKKKTFKPGIRPFVQRPKSSYSPKRRLPGATSATTVTRNDFTPTVTAIPASKGRFGNRRNSASIQPTSSGSRRFSRPKSSSSYGGRRGSSRIQPSSTGFGASSRRGFRSSSSGGFSKSSALFSNSQRFRIRPTASSSYIKSSPSSSVTESSENDDDNNLTTLVTDEPDESENETTLQISTTTETSRRQNPLLRFRRPPLGRPAIGRPTTPRSRSNSASRNNNKVGTTTSKPKTTRASILNRNRPNGLFPRRNLFPTSTTQAPPEEEEEESDAEDEVLIEENEEEEDTDYEGSQKQTQTAKPPPSTRTGLVKIKPFNFRRRTRRDTYSRFRRPTSKTTSAPIDEDYLDYEVPKPKPKHNRFSPRSRTSKLFHSSTQSAPTTPRKRIIPNKVKPQSRTQFTLRPEKEKSNFRRPGSSRSRTTTTSRSRPRIVYNNHQTEPSNHRKSSGRVTSRNNSNRRGSSRQKAQSKDINDNYILPAFDGTITITHQIPTEVTIPVINGKITEYKNIITAKMSTEILDPAQYSTSLNQFGKEVTVLVNELTTIGNNGATLITQFVLNETPTTSVIFTPTYIRNRKTSYSHVIPSTIYAVEHVVNTIQPALAAQAPLANILLSQLLLGGLQSQNPLLALQNPAAIPTPTTEYKTRTTTYVTTVTSSTSTVIPLTFRGKEILTTIVDSSVNVITATEFLTDTIVVTPTIGFPVAAPQLNTLLLPLLQQQLAQSSPQLVPNPLSRDSPQLAQLDEPETFNLALDDNEKPLVSQAKPRSSKGNKKPKKPRVEPSKETSIITLYVSGKTPGEFSTVLSTIISDPKERRRRDSGEEIKPSASVDDLVISTLDYLDTYVLPGRRDFVDYNSEMNSETESLESILGDVNKHIKSTSKNNVLMNPTKMDEFTKKFRIKNIESFSNQNKLNNFLV